MTDQHLDLLSCHSWATREPLKRPPQGPSFGESALRGGDGATEIPSEHNSARRDGRDFMHVEASQPESIQNNITKFHDAASVQADDRHVVTIGNLDGALAHTWDGPPAKGDPPHGHVGPPEDFEVSPLDKPEGPPPAHGEHQQCRKQFRLRSKDRRAIEVVGESD